ncbi:MAG: hypothetical protein NT004_03865 [Bacteroidetes bacterium]|nr:hypothetical protein [Bacteroidota bacterium]
MRFDYKFHQFINERNWFPFGFNNFDSSIKLKYVLEPDYILFKYEEGQVYKGVSTNKSNFDVANEIINFIEVTKDEHPGRIKYSANQNHILISSLKGAKSPALFFNADMSDYVFSNGFYIFKIKKNWHKKFLAYILRSRQLKEILDTNLSRGIGIPTYREKDFLRLRMPDIDVVKQHDVVKIIAPLEAEIKKLNSQIKPDTDIIDEVFTSWFGWDEKAFQELRNVHLMSIPFSAFANNIDNRFSFKFHNKPGAYISQILKAQTSKRIKDYLSEDITLGKSISPSDYNENGEQYYVSMADIKNWRFETEEAKTVDQSYFDANPNKRIALNDILMARSGEGTIGKVAIIDNDETDAVYADFTMRIKLKNYNPVFAYYYFRTGFFQYLINTHKKGLGNNTNIFPSQVRELPIPEISFAVQEKIVAVIKNETDKQREFDKKIHEKKEEINQIIINAITK